MAIDVRGNVTYGPSIATDGLILYLDAANVTSYPGTGLTWFDLSPSQAHGTFSNGGVTFSTLNAGSFDYPSTTNVVTAPMLNLRPTASITQECWVIITSNTTQVFIGAQFGSSTDNSYALWLNNTNQLASGIRNTSSFQFQTLNFTFTTNIPYHLVHTYDGANQRMYVNGVIGLSWSTTGAIVYDALNTQLAVGNDFSSGYNGAPNTGVRGRLAIVRLYNRALSAAEIFQNFNAQRGRFGV